MNIARCVCCLVGLAGVALCQPGLQPDFRFVDDGAGGSSDWGLRPAAPDALPVAVNAPCRGWYPVGSKIPDTEALGGFGPCSHYPKELRDAAWGRAGELTLIAFPQEKVQWGKHRSLALRLVNRSHAIVAFPASDSQLYLRQEARAQDGRWLPIESPPRVICGNSFHRVLLGPDQFWEFAAHDYSGPVRTKLRFRLALTADGNRVLYSNEFDGSIHPGQFDVRPQREDEP